MLDNELVSFLVSIVWHQKLITDVIVVVVYYGRKCDPVRDIAVSTPIQLLMHLKY